MSRELSEREINEFVQLMKAYVKQLDTKEKAIDFLVKTGIYNKDGTLNKNYR